MNANDGDYTTRKNEMQTKRVYDAMHGLHVIIEGGLAHHHYQVTRQSARDQRLQLPDRG